jgi:hypothetical protein
MIDLVNEIMSELYKACEVLGADSDLLCIIGSFRDTLPDDEFLTMIRDYNETGITWSKVSYCIKAGSQECVSCKNRHVCMVNGKNLEQ